MGGQTAGGRVHDGRHARSDGDSGAGGVPACFVGGPVAGMVSVCVSVHGAYRRTATLRRACQPLCHQRCAKKMLPVPARNVAGNAAGNATGNTGRVASGCGVLEVCNDRRSDAAPAAPRRQTRPAHDATRPDRPSPQAHATPGTRREDSCRWRCLRLVDGCSRCLGGRRVHRFGVRVFAGDVAGVDRRVSVPALPVSGAR